MPLCACVVLERIIKIKPLFKTFNKTQKLINTTVQAILKHNY